MLLSSVTTNVMDDGIHAVDVAGKFIVSFPQH